MSNVSTPAGFASPAGWPGRAGHDGGGDGGSAWTLHSGCHDGAGRRCHL